MSYKEQLISLLDLLDDSTIKELLAYVKSFLKLR